MCYRLPPFYFDCGGQSNEGYSWCIPIKQFCDSNPDCPNNADENNCPTDGTKLCNGACILDSEPCLPPAPCEFPSFSCDQGKKCLPSNQIYDGIAQCADGKDEEGCAHNSQGTEDRCHYGNIFGDGLLNDVMGNSVLNDVVGNSVLYDVLGNVSALPKDYLGDREIEFDNRCALRKEITAGDKIEIDKGPNATYDVEPNMEIVIDIVAHTDPDWQNQMSYQWFWYMPVTTPTEAATPTHLSMSRKELTFTIPDVKTPVMEGNTAEYDIYQDLTDDRLFSINISHQFDHRVVNFTVKGKELEKPTCRIQSVCLSLWPLSSAICTGTEVVPTHYSGVFGTFMYDLSDRSFSSVNNLSCLSEKCNLLCAQARSRSIVDDFFDDTRDAETGINAEVRWDKICDVIA
ncbi:hypothetical protein DPMN_072514 [Dreissena polymorpha]|uniref:Uncharacterized protein n=1 Tax=Dreissena polymorpha TaxID=45954 RepID=A0A9D4BXJ3_DREPO|nr:hypothetical protein DPMN_072514 [Dreissena polymorpha]